MKTLHLLFVISTVIFLVVIGESNSILAQTSHQPGSVENLQLFTPKSNYVDGEIIPIIGDTLQNLVINIFLIDSHGNIENSTQVIGNNTGYFNTSLGIPSYVEGGSWSLFAKSGESNFATQIMVNSHGENPPPFNSPSGFAPLKQFKLGIEPRYIQCKTGLQLIMKSEDGSPACVKYTSSNVLIQRGWAKEIAPDMSGSETVVTIPINSSNTSYRLNFTPSIVKAIIGENNTVQWINMDSVVNDIASDTGSFSSGAIDSGYAWTHTFDKTGIYDYHSNVHPWLKGTVIVTADPMGNLRNDTGIITLKNQTYYFETPQYNETAYVHHLQISFHDVTFTLFPSGYRGGLPAWGCGGAYYWVDAKFSDGTSELLQIFVGSQDCHLPQPSTHFSNHANPQVGLTFYDGKMKLLVSTSVTNSMGN